MEDLTCNAKNLLGKDLLLVFTPLCSSFNSTLSTMKEQVFSASAPGIVKIQPSADLLHPLGSVIGKNVCCFTLRLSTAAAPPAAPLRPDMQKVGR